jgi:hypothetical protein
MKTILIVLIVTLFLSHSRVGAQPTAATKADSGWVALFNGSDFTGFYIYSKDVGVVSNFDTQTLFQLDSGRIHSPRLAGEYHLITSKEYSYYKVRLDYRWGDTSGSQNAGLVIHIDNTQAYSGTLPIGTLRPRSIEVQMLRTSNQPFTLWSSWELGPYITTTVQSGTSNYLAAASGGVPWINNPWGSRTVFTTVKNSENKVGQWNQGEAEVYGDSGAFYLNGVLRTKGWHFQVRGSANDSTTSKRVAYKKGGIGIQQEDNEIWYRNYEIMELDSITRMPINARRGCTSPSAANYDTRAVVDNGSCSSTAIFATPKPTGGMVKRKRSYNLRGQKEKGVGKRSGIPHFTAF